MEREVTLLTENQESPSIALYTAEDNSIQLDVKLENETVWLSQQQMAMLFGTDRTSILRHINNIYKSEELDEVATCAKIAQVRLEGKRQVERTIPFYNLDMIISVGYRVNSKSATRFRRWATSILKDYLVKGYAVNQKITLQRYEELKDVVRLDTHSLAKGNYRTVMKKLLIFVMLFSSFGMRAMAQIDSTYIPKNLKDCIRVLDSILPDSTKAQYVAIDESAFSSASHFGMGLTIRNTWGLWRGSRLSEYFVKKGVHHPDDMSGIILRCYHRHLTGKPMRVHGLIRHTRHAWRKEYGRVKMRTMKGGNNKSFEENAAFLNLPRIDSVTGAYMDNHGRKLTAQDSAYLQRHSGRFHGVARIDTCGHIGNVKSVTADYRRGKNRTTAYYEFDKQRRVTNCYRKTFRKGDDVVNYKDCYRYHYDSVGLLREKTEYDSQFEHVIYRYRYDYDSNGYTITECNIVNSYHLADGRRDWTYNDDTIAGILDSSYLEIYNVDTILLDENGRVIAELRGDVYFYQYDSLGRQVVWLTAWHNSETGWCVPQGGVFLYDEGDGRNYYLDFRNNNVTVMYTDKHGNEIRNCYQDFKGKRAPRSSRISYDRHGNPKRIKNLRDGSTIKYHFRYY